MEANLKRRLTKGFLFGVAYTWSKSLDYGSSNGTNIPNAFDNSIMYGPSDFDTRHVMVANYVWDIPFATHSTHRLERPRWATGSSPERYRLNPAARRQERSRATSTRPALGLVRAINTTCIPAHRDLPHQFGSGSPAFSISSRVCFNLHRSVLSLRGALATSSYGPGFQSYQRRAAERLPFHSVL